MRNFLIYLFILIFQFSIAQEETAKDSTKTTELKEVVVQSKKKSIEQRADRTIFDFSEQSHLNSGSLMEGLKKLPGLIVSDVAGMMYQGKQLEVFMDARPLNIYSNELTSYLESLPANSIEKVEIITQPGAEFPATSGGAIINIVTSKNAKKYLSATYSNGYSYTNYDKSRHRFNNSLLVNAKNKWFGWQVQLGQNYNNAYQRTNFADGATVLSKNITDRENRFYFFKTGLKFDLKKDRFLINYDYTTSNNRALIDAEGFGFETSDKSKNKLNRNDVALNYQKRFDDVTKKLDFRFNVNSVTNNFDLTNRVSGNSVLDNGYNQLFYQFKTDYSQEFDFLEKTKFSTGVLADKLEFEAQNLGATNLDYQRTTLAAYSEFQSTYKKFDFILGGRLESYSIEGDTDTGDLVPFNQTRFFPNASIQYNIIPQVFVNANYNKKISLPNTSALNPNNTNYQNPNVSFYGNPNLEPTIFDNYEFKISAFEYFFIGYSRSDANNQVMNRIIVDGAGAASISENIPQVTIHNFNLGLPVPYMLFTKGLKETLKFNFNPDEINFLYLYVGHQKHVLPDVNEKGLWFFNVMSQIVLPSKIKFTANYNTSSTGGNYYYYKNRSPFSQQLDVTFAKKFLDNNLSVSLYCNDIFNTNKQGFNALGTNLVYGSKNDSRRVGITLNYKIPTKNKLAKEEGNILNNDKKDDQPAIGN
ncbi:TonB-dependent receptor domain-containing protein [Flavobacterium sp.]|uniref:TonB-dependent receptor domain-containing protein n=1 Tax=Flavobacterium sp. TaxID=239 RepID=UPI0035B2457A